MYVSSLEQGLFSLVLGTISDNIGLGGAGKHMMIGYNEVSSIERMVVAMPKIANRVANMSTTIFKEIKFSRNGKTHSCRQQNAIGYESCADGCLLGESEKANSRVSFRFKTL